MSTTYDTESILREVLDARAADIHTALPGKVVSYDAAVAKSAVPKDVRGP